MIYDSDFFTFTKHRSKDHEKALIFRELDEAPDCSKRRLVEKGFRPNSVSNVITELLDDNLILENGREVRRQRGRPEIFYTVNAGRMRCISIYAEGMELKAALMNLSHEILAENSVRVDKDVDNAAFLEVMLGLVKSLLPAKSSGGIEGIVVSLPGNVRSDEKLWVSSFRWPEIRNFDFTALEKRLGTEVHAFKETHSILKYQLLVNPSYKTGATILLKWGYALGFGYASDGVLLDSAFGRYGEIGHTLIAGKSKKRCVCGETGCVETDVAVWALLPQLAKSHPGLDDDEPSFSRLLSKKSVYSIPPLKRALSRMRICLHTLCHFFYPDRVLFVGPFTESEEVFSDLREHVVSTMMSDYAKSIEFHVIRDAYHGCLHSNAHFLFSRRLEPLLKARY